MNLTTLVLGFFNEQEHFTTLKKLKHQITHSGQIYEGTDRWDGDGGRWRMKGKERAVEGGINILVDHEERMGRSREMKS